MVIYYQIIANRFKSRLYLLLTDALIDALELTAFEIVEVAKGQQPKLMARKEL